jgi:sugar phosphate isomerase/epimerase
MIRKFLDISTAHLSPEAKAWLDECGWCNAEASHYYDSAKHFGGSLGSVGLTLSGYLTWCPQEDHDEDDWHGMPPDLAHVCRHARSLGCDYVLFDADSMPIDDLPTWEW